MSQQDMDQTGCLAGCDRTPRDPACRPTAGQMLHQLHGMSAAEQVDFMQRMLDASDTAVWCFTRDHEGRLARDDDERALLLWLHAEAVWEAHVASDTADDWCAKWEAAEASRRDWAAEAAALADQLESRQALGDVILHGYDTITLALAKRWGQGKTDKFLAQLQEAFPFQKSRGVTVDEAGVVELVGEPGPNAPCSCLTAEQAAVVTAGGFSLPRCAVHPETDR